MRKKVLLSGFVMLWFCMSFVSIASDINAATYKWFKFEVTYPTDFVFDKPVVVELTNKDTKETFTTYIKKEDDYISYLNVTEGVYEVSNVSVPGNYEGYFTYGYPDTAFSITSTSNDMTIVPILLELSYYGDDATNQATDNLYEGMTYDEVMAEIEKETIKETDTTVTKTEDVTASDTSTNKETSYYDNKDTSDKKTLDEKITEIKDVYEKSEHEKQKKQAVNNELMGGVIVMCVVLIGVGIGFFIVKKKRDI